MHPNRSNRNQNRHQNDPVQRNPQPRQHDVVGAASGGGRVRGPPSGRGRAVCAPGCARPMHFKASRFTHAPCQRRVSDLKTPQRAKEAPDHRITDCTQQLTRSVCIRTSSFHSSLSLLCMIHYVDLVRTAWYYKKPESRE